MRKNFVVCLVLFICLLCPVSAIAAPSRIVSLSPVGTEMLFDLGQGGNIIAVTEFCDYPPEAGAKPKIGGYAEINLEALLAMKTDLLVLQDIHKQFAPQLERLRIPFVILRQDSVEGIYESITRLGELCGAEKRAARRVAAIRADLAEIASKISTAKRPRVMLCVSRELSERRISGFYIAAADNFYNELIRLAGGENALRETRSAYPHISVEGLIRLDPDVIIDLVGDRRFYHSKDPVDVDAIFNKEYLTAQWRATAAVSAVKKGRIEVLEGTVYLRPGPRVAQIVLAFARAIHPEARL